MYKIALTVAACLRAGTRADVAWLVDGDGLQVKDWSEAVAFTPGGGRAGSLLGGALDGQLADRVGRAATARLVTVEVGAVDALIAGLPSGGTARAVLAPAEALPAEVWDLALARRPIVLAATVAGDELTGIRLLDPSGAAPGSTLSEGELVSVFVAVPRLVVAGGGPIADALARAAELVGWQATIAPDAETAAGEIAGLSAIDKVVVAGHDLDLTAAALLAALESAAGYIGSLGGRKMQQDRADWLAYRGVTDLDRVHGPAGLDIGASTPGEIAVSIVAEAIAAAATATREPVPPRMGGGHQPRRGGSR